MKKIAVLILALYASVCPSMGQKKASVQKVLNKTITVKYTQDIVSILADDQMQGRESGTPGFDKAADFIIAQLKKSKILPLLNSDFKTPIPHEKTTAFYNVVGVIKSKKNQHAPIILSAHLDHLGIKKNNTGGKDSVYNGANDDASGVTAVVQIAQFLSQFTFDRDIILAFFGGEEKGLLGSKALAKQMKIQNMDLAYMINFEMIGNMMQNSKNTAYLTGFDLSNMATELNKNAESPFVIKDPIDEKFKLFTRSDNYSFYEIYKIPAHTLATFDFPEKNYYHQLGDETAYLDIENMNQIIKQAALSIYQILENNAPITMF